MSKIKLAVIFGGKSSEYSVSLHSASSAIRNIDLEKYDLTLIGISPKGDWYYYDGSIEDLEHDKWRDDPSVCEVTLSTSHKEGFIKLDNGKYEFIKVDCILPVLHGKNGEDGTLQGLLELSGIPYVGCDHLCSAMSMDKAITHIICKNADIKMADYVELNNNSSFDFDKAFKLINDQLEYPVFVKPANAGSSYGITKVSDGNFEKMKEALKYAFEHDTKVIVENGIDGFEVGCAVMGNDYNSLIVGELDEIDTKNDYFDFEAKYALENTQIHCPARLSAEKTLEIKETAKKIYQVMGCSGLSRIDLFVDKNEDVYFNELNTIPGFTDTSRYPSMMKEIGMDFTTLINNLVELAINKK